MLENVDVERIATEVVSANTAPQSVVSVTARGTTASTGEDALRISIVLAPEAEANLQGETPVNILVQLSDRLLEAGEARFPILDYATTDELADVVDDS